MRGVVFDRYARPRVEQGRSNGDVYRVDPRTGERTLLTTAADACLDKADRVGKNMHESRKRGGYVAASRR